MAIMLLNLSALAQNNLITGTVLDENKEAMIGVNISIDDNTGTTTDIEGNFELEINRIGSNSGTLSCYDLIFQFLGYKTHKEEVCFGESEKKNMIITM